MVETRNILSIERMKRRVYDNESKRVKELNSHLICITWEGSRLPEEIKLYGGAMRLRVRPYVSSVLQCFNYYGYGHLQKHCRNKKRCLVCGEVSWKM